MVLSVTHRRFPGIPLADLEDAYSRLVSEQALARPFGSAGEVVAWVLEAMRNDAKDILRSARVRTNSQLPDETEPATGGADGFAVPEDAAIAGELRGLLREFLAELSDDDRRIAYLHLDPDWRWSHKQIAKQLGIPLRDVRLTVGRVSRRLDRFGRLYSDPSALCQRRREDVIAFQATGQASLALRMHLRRCPSCGVELRRSQQQLRSAILPLLPAGAVPAASLGLIARINRAAATHPATQRVNDTIARTRKLIPGGAAGGGGAAITAKILAAGTGLTVGAALQVVRGTERQTPHHQHRLARVAAVTTAPAATTDHGCGHPDGEHPDDPAAPSTHRDHNGDHGHHHDGDLHHPGRRADPQRDRGRGAHLDEHRDREDRERDIYPQSIPGRVRSPGHDRDLTPQQPWERRLDLEPAPNRREPRALEKEPFDETQLENPHPHSRRGRRRAARRRQLRTRVQHREQDDHRVRGEELARAADPESLPTGTKPTFLGTAGGAGGAGKSSGRRGRPQRPRGRASRQATSVPVCWTARTSPSRRTVTACTP